MTCLSTLRRTWPFSICVTDDSEDDEWPPPWPKIKDGSEQGYSRSRETIAPSGLGFSAADLASPSIDSMKKGHKVKTSRQRLPPIPNLPEQYYGLPAESRARSPSLTESGKRRQSRNKLVKTRTQSFSKSKARPAIGVPSDFRKVAGATSNVVRAEPMPMPAPMPMPPRRESWRHIQRRSGLRRAAFRPLELSIYEPGNELRPLPRFSRLILDPRRQSYMTEAAESRPTSEIPPMPSQMPYRRSSPPSRKTSRSISRSFSRHAMTPKMPFTRDNSDDEASDVSFDDLESVVDPDFNPAPVRNRARGQSTKAGPYTSPNLSHPVQPPPPLKTKSLMPPSRENKGAVSPESPNSKNIHPPSLRLDDLPSAFSSPASPHPPSSWPIPPGGYDNLDAAVATTNLMTGSMPPAQYAYNTTHKVSTPERSLNPNGLSQSPPKESSSRQSPTPSNESTASTTMTATSNSAQSYSTAATTPPSPPQPKQALVTRQPKPQPILTQPLAPAPAHLRDIEVQRVVADTTILQPVPRVPPKSPKRFLPTVLDDNHTSEIPEYPKFRAELSAEKRSVGDAEQARITQWPVTMQTAYAQYQQQQQQQQQPQQQQQRGSPPQPKSTQPPVRPARPDDPPSLRKQQPAPQQQQQQQPPPQAQAQRPELHIQTPQSQKPKDWALTGSAWREVVWGLKRRTQEEAALKMREQQVIIDAIPETASAQDDSDEAAATRDALWTKQSQRQQSYHSRGGSSGGRGSESTTTDSRNSSMQTNVVMEVPVGLAFSAPPPEQEPHRAAEASNDALLQMQPRVRHDMHAIAEEEEDEDAGAANKPIPRKTLSVVNGMPPAEESDSSDSDSDSDASGEEVEFGVDEGVWEMVDSNPASARQSLVPSRASSTALQPSSNNLTLPASRWSRSSRGSVYVPHGAAARDSATLPSVSEEEPDTSTGTAPRMPPMPRAVSSSPPRPKSGSSSMYSTQRASSSSPARNSRSSTSSRSSRGSVFIPAGFDPLKGGAAPTTGVVPPMPSMPPMPKEVGAPTVDQKQRPPQQWGRGIGMEFGVAY